MGRWVNERGEGLIGNREQGIGNREWGEGR